MFKIILSDYLHYSLLFAVAPALVVIGDANERRQDGASTIKLVLKHVVRKDQRRKWQVEGQ